MAVLPRMMRRDLPILAVVLALGAAPTAAGSAGPPLGKSNDDSPLGNKRLSNERT